MYIYLKNHKFLACFLMLSLFVFSGSAYAATAPKDTSKENPQYVDKNGDGICDNTGEAIPDGNKTPGGNKGNGSQKKDGTNTPDGSANRGENKGGGQGGTGGGNGGGSSGGGQGSGGNGNGRGGGRR